MISHIFIGTNSFERAHGFYGPVLNELGLVQKFADSETGWAGWMQRDQPRPLLLVGRPYEGEHAVGNGQMTALLAPSRAAVDAVHRVALANGATCEGAPGLRPRYHANYYGAYFRDLDGNKLCVVCHDAS